MASDSLFVIVMAAAEAAVALAIRAEFLQHFQYDDVDRENEGRS